MSENSSKITHRVWIEGRNPGVGFRRLGTVFSHSDGKGSNVVLDVRVVGVVAVCRDASEESGPDPKLYGQEKWRPDPNMVSHNVFAVLDKGEGKDDYWCQCGRAYAHSDGKGFTLLMDDAWPDDLKPVLRVPKDEPPKGRKSYGKR